MSEIGLGRRFKKDTRDRAYLIPLQSINQSLAARTWVIPGKVLDQGSTAQCVAYSGVKYLTAYPVRNRPKEKPAEIYRECLLVDEWEGEDWDGGTSVRALFKVLKRLGYVSEYRWAFDCETVVNHVLTRGPVVMGTEWHHDMFMPHKTTGYLSVTGPNVGGHAWLIIGANRKRKNPDGSTGAVRMVNSWGDGWGQKGRAWITFRDLEKLIAADGEACVSTEMRISLAGSYVGLA
jgi:C1A family cysteine protease